MKKLLPLFVFVAWSLGWMGVSGAQECPEGFQCLTEDQAADVREALLLHNCMVDAAENDDIDFQLQPHQITVTKDGQVFVQDKVSGTLKWCTWELELEGTTDVTVHREVDDEADIGFQLRIKLGVTWLPTLLTQSESAIDTFDPVLLFEPFHLWQFHPQIYAGLRTFGLTVGMDITRNLDFFVGSGILYRDAKVLPVIGVSLSASIDSPQKGLYHA